MDNKRADAPFTMRAKKLAETRMIPIAHALGWDEPDPYDNKTIRDFLYRLLDYDFVNYVEQSARQDREIEEAVAALRLVAAYVEGLGETPAALAPAVAIAKKHAS